MCIHRYGSICLYISISPYNYISLSLYIYIYICMYLLYIISLGELVRLVCPPGTGKSILSAIPTLLNTARRSYACARDICLLNAGEVGGGIVFLAGVRCSILGPVIAARHIGSPGFRVGLLDFTPPSHPTPLTRHPPIPDRFTSSLP
jgi:hypothetical protein